MRHSTRSLTIALASAAAIAAAPLVFDYRGPATAEATAAVTSEAAEIATPDPTGPPTGAPGAGQVDPAAFAGVEVPVVVPGIPSALPRTEAPDVPPGSGLPVGGTAGRGSGMGGDLPPEALPEPPYPQCPITEAGAWWTDPADPYTCIPPGSLPFHEPTPPGISPELLEPIFEQPVPPAPGEDCRLVGALQCTVTIMGQDYVVTFAEGRPVGVSEAR